MKNKFIVSLFLFLSLGLLALYGGYEYLLWRAVPPTEGEVSLRGLSRNVRVYRDAVGIPHIEAENEKDLYRALGFVNASERLFQLDLYRRAGRGELSEIFGEQTLQRDKFAKILAFDGAFDFSGRIALRAEVKEKVEAYLEGINFFIETAPLPIEFILLGYTPRSFSLRDVYAFIGLMAFRFGNASRQDPLFQKLSKVMDIDSLNLMGNEIVRSNKEVISDYPTNLAPLFGQEGAFLADVDGSNAWVLSPKRSKNGKAILASDPHINYSLPGIWFEAHLKSPSFEIYGHFLPLIPFAAIGHNENHAWGLTISYVDDMDFYQEEIDWKKERIKYRGEFQPLKKKVHKIIVKNGPNVEFTSYWGPHGPLIGSDIAASERPEFALQWTYHHKDNRPVEAFFEFNYAKNMDEMRLATSLGTAPGLNILYADKHGNIAWWMYGAIPLRPRGMQGDRIYPGGSGEYEWLGHMDSDLKPQSENPASGIIVSANGKPPGANSRVKGYWHSQDRASTIYRKLAVVKSWTKKETRALQTSNINHRALRIVEMMGESLASEDFGNKLHQKSFLSLLNWNGESSGDSKGALIYHVLYPSAKMRNLHGF